MTDAPRVRVPVGARLRGTFADPVLRSLTIATLISTVGRGVALTLVVLYLSLIARLPAEQVALVFAVGSGIGVAASYFGGHLADTISARALLVGGVVLAGLIKVMRSDLALCQQGCGEGDGHHSGGNELHIGFLIRRCRRYEQSNPFPRCPPIL